MMNSPSSLFLRMAHRTFHALRQHLICLAAALLSPAGFADIVYDDGGTHTINDASFQSERLIVRNGTTLRVVDGATIWQITLFDTSRLEMSGGDLDGTTSRIDGWGNSTIEISGGSFGPTNTDFIAGNVQVRQSSRLTISGGVFGGPGERSGQIVGVDDAVVTISGGSFGGTGELSGFIEMIDRNELTVTGGHFGSTGKNSGKYNVRLDSTVTVSGGTFDGIGDGSGRFTVAGTGLINNATFINGARIESIFTGHIRIPGRSFNLPFGPVADLQGSLTGVLADGSTFSADYYRGYDPDLENGTIELVEVCEEIVGEAELLSIKELLGLEQLPVSLGDIKLSGDGTVVVGRVRSDAFRYIVGGSSEVLGDLPGGVTRSSARGVAGNGNVVVGAGNSTSGQEAFRWDPQTGMTGLGDLPGGTFQSAALDASHDGSVIVGWGRGSSGQEAFRWSPSTGMTGLGDLSGGITRSNAWDVSSDGSTIVGFGHSANGTEAFRWSQAEGMVGLGTLAGGWFSSVAWGVSADGSVIVGSSGSSRGTEAFRWHATTGMQGLGFLPGATNFFSESYDVSGDGTRIVGTANGSGGYRRAFLWEEGIGMRDLKDLLEQEYGLDLSAWLRLTDAFSISDDGLVILGRGIDLRGFEDAFLVRLPTPNSAPIVTCPSPPASFQCDAASTPDNSPGARVVLSAIVSDADGQNLTVIWEVDGVEVQRTGNVPSGSTVELDHVFPLGASEVTVTVEDCFVSDSCSTTVTVVDTVAPVAVCQPSLTVPNDPGACEAANVTLSPPTVSENCEVASISNDAPSIFPLGETVVTWTITDVGGNSGTCQQTVTVEDTEPPVLVCPPDLVVGHDLDSGSAANVDLGQPLEVSDNCEVVSLTNTAPDSFPIGETEVVWIAKDAAGNDYLCSQFVTVTNEAPTVECPVPVQVDCSDGQPRAFVELSAPIDDADHSSLEVTWAHTNGQVLSSYQAGRGSNASFSAYFPLGTTTIVLTVSDGIDSADCQIPVTVLDLTHPVVFCLRNVEVGTDPGQCFASNVDLGNPFVSDNCGPVSVTNNAPLTYPIGQTTVAWTATDGSGNVATCTQIVTVVDDESPALTCPPDVVVSHDPDLCEATGVALGAATASDNCEVTSLTHNAPSSFVLGDTIVTRTATDAAGNITTCDQIVTVTNADPTAEAGEDVAVNCTSPAGAVVTLDGAASSDPEGDTLEFRWSAEGIGFDDNTSATPIATFPVGSTRVTLTVTDRCGAVDSANVLVVVFDAVAPVIQITDSSHDMLWPPNHELVPVTLSLIVADDCVAPQDLVVTCSVTSDEPDDTTGDGAFTGDVNGQDGYNAEVPVTMTWDAATGSWQGTVSLRSERKGKGDGRKYAVRCSASDGENTTHATICIVVPQSKGGPKKK